MYAVRLILWVLKVINHRRQVIENRDRSGLRRGQSALSGHALLQQWLELCTTTGAHQIGHATFDQTSANVTHMVTHKGHPLHAGVELRLDGIEYSRFGLAAFAPVIRVMGAIENTPYK